MADTEHMVRGTAAPKERSKVGTFGCMALALLVAFALAVAAIYLQARLMG